MTSTVRNFVFLRQTEVTYLVYSHTDGKWRRQDLSVARSIWEVSSILSPSLAPGSRAVLTMGIFGCDQMAAAPYHQLLIVMCVEKQDHQGKVPRKMENLRAQARFHCFHFDPGMEQQIWGGGHVDSIDWVESWDSHSGLRRRC